MPRQIARVALLLLVLGALGLQQWAVRSHWHAPAAVAGVAQAAGDTGDGSGLHDCAWCQAGAHAGAAAPPSSWVALRAHALFLHRPAAGFTRDFAPPPAWAWHSRGPPAA